MQISIYVSNLKKYVEGMENGKWIRLPMDKDRLKVVLNDIVGENQEHIILDYNAPFSISEYESIWELNVFMTVLSESKIEEDMLAALFKAGERHEVMEHIQSGTFSIVNVDEVCKDWSSGLSGEELYGMVLNATGYNNLFSIPISEEMEDYMDFAQIFTCLSINDGWMPVRVGDTTYLVTF